MIDRIPELPGAGRLGRHVEHDEQSRSFSAEPAQLGKPRTKLWERYSPILDQGSLGSCTGNALAGWLGCAPHSTDREHAARYDETFAIGLYAAATRVDPFPGTYPPQDTGSSGLAVCKAAKRAGILAGYSWVFTVNGLLHALQTGPVIVGVPWYEGMDEPDQYGIVEPAGQVRGGHEFLVRGCVQDNTAPGGWWLLADNSWSESYGAGGSFWLSLTTWSRLRSERADVTVPKAEPMRAGGVA